MWSYKSVKTILIGDYPGTEVASPWPGFGWRGEEKIKSSCPCSLLCSVCSSDSLFVYLLYFIIWINYLPHKFSFTHHGGCVRVHDDDEQPRGHARVKYIFDIVVLAKMPYMINQWACNITSFHLYVVWKRNSRRVVLHTVRWSLKENAAIGIAYLAMMMCANSIHSLEGCWRTVGIVYL